MVNGKASAPAAAATAKADQPTAGGALSGDPRAEAPEPTAERSPDAGAPARRARGGGGSGVGGVSGHGRGGGEPLAPAPRHVAIIMDGNGRWAKARLMPRLAGHRKGADAVRAVVRACPALGVEVLTLFAFSTENWRRSEEEVSGLMDLFRFFLKREMEPLHRENVRVRFIGDRTRLADDLRELMKEIEERTRDNTLMTLVVALNYGARAEIAAAARHLAEKVQRGELAASKIDEDALDGALDTADLPDPDLVIRTSGEQRLSNFLLWQCAYSEFVFASEAWPEFNGETLRRAVDAYRRRDRRYGSIESV